MANTQTFAQKKYSFSVEDVSFYIKNKNEKLPLPTERSSLIMWLLGFPQEFRTTSKEAYNELFAKQEMNYSSRVCKRLILASDSHYSFAFYNYYFWDDELLPVAAYVKTITNKELVNIILKLNIIFPCPISDIKEIMKSNLTFTDSQITEALKL